LPLTDQEYETFQSPYVARPDDYWQRLNARNRQQLREVLAKRAAAKQRQERERAAHEAGLNRTAAYLEAVHELQQEA